MADFAATEEEVEAIRIRARARAREEGLYEPPDTTWDDIGKRFNKGLWDVVSLPSDMINAGIRFRSGPVEPIQLPTEDARQYLASKGMIPDPDDPAEGIPEHAAELLGAGAIPHAAITAKGQQLLNQSILQIERLGVFESMAVGTAAYPKAAAVGEAIAATGAATGRTVAEENDASPTVQITAELLGALTPAAFLTAAKNLSAIRFFANAVQKHLFPFTKPGAWQRASQRMRDLAADPERSARRIDAQSDVPPARQAGDENLLALEKSVLSENPELASETNKTLDKIREALKFEVLNVFGGDKARPRKILTQAKQYLFDLLDLRAAKAADDVRSRVNALDPNATPREVNQQVRGAVDDAYADARAQETELWKAIDSDAPVEPSGARETLRTELASRSRFDDPEDIPKWVIAALGKETLDPQLVSQLKKAGAMDADGNFLPGMRERLVEEGVISESTYNFNDIKTIRERVLREIRAEQAKDAPNRNKIRILGSIANGTVDENGAIVQAGLLDDIGDAGVAGATEARDFSQQLNEKFTRGQVGRLLGFDKTGAERISEAATLDYLLAGRDPMVNVSQLVRAAPETKPLIENYLKAEFIGQTSGGSNRKAAERFIAKWERRGVFEEYPELRGQLTKYADSADAANALQVRADRVRTHANNSGKSTAALYLNSDPGDEMRLVLASRRPAANARKLRAKMGGDSEAEAGLRTSFLEEGFASSGSGKFHADGSPIYSGDRFTGYLAKNKEVARALGVSDSEWRKLESIALRMRQLDAKPGDAVGQSIKDAPSALLDLAARWIGAQQGGRLGNSMGSSLVMAGAFSERMRMVLDRLTRNTAKQLLIDAHNNNPTLYRALLTNPTMPEPQQAKAAKTIQSWLIAVGATQEIEDE